MPENEAAPRRGQLQSAALGQTMRQQLHGAAPLGKGAPSEQAGAALLTLLALLDARVAALVDQLLRERCVSSDPDPWIPHTHWPWPRRKARELAASGAIQGAHKVAKTWLVRRSALDAYIEAHAAPAAPITPTPANDAGAAHEEDDVDEVLRRRGFRRTARRQ